MTDMTYAEASKRLSGREWRRYRFAWIWSNFRFSNLEGSCYLQEACTRRWGIKKTMARINKVRKILGASPLEQKDYPNS